MVSFCSLFIFFIYPNIDFLATGSSILVASSKIKTSGCKASAEAIATRCFWPPESEDGSNFLYSFISTMSNTSLIICSISSRGRFLFSNPNAISSSTVAPTN